MAQGDEPLGPNLKVRQSDVLRFILEESRRYAVEFYKHCFLVSAGAITLSAGVLLRAEPPTLTGELVWYLKASWMFLSGSMLGSIISFGLMMYFTGLMAKGMRDYLSGKRANPPEPGWAQRVSTVLDFVVAMVCVLGVVFMAYVAIALVKVDG